MKFASRATTKNQSVIQSISNQSVSFRGLKNIIPWQKSEIVSNSLKNITFL